ncbi:MAG: S9 family peptidase, partial [Candidatus Krumholzibacteriota bacterium]|nr:S9 family peptidase [Candidatus Krumholzibacteriota bacterium]
MTISHVLEVPGVSSVDISPDGTLAAITFSRMNPPEGKRDNWIEIRRLQDGHLLRTIRDAELWNLEWVPVGKRLSYRTTHDQAGYLRVLDLEIGSTETILEGVKDLGGYLWAPDGSFIVYDITESPPPDKTGVKRLRGIRDRTDYARRTSALYLSSVPGGATRKLTTGKKGADLGDIHPDGKKMLIYRNYEDLSRRPYGITEMYLLNLQDQSTELLYRGYWLGRGSWSPDGKKILIPGGPSTFGDIGINLPQGKIPNDYDTQLYIFDPETKTAEAITRDFKPAVNRAVWSKGDGNIYFTAEETEYTSLYRYDPGKKTFKKIKLDVEVLGSGDISKNKPVAVFSGCRADQPWRLYAFDLKRGKEKLLIDPGAEEFSHIKLPRVETWNFTSEQGKSIVGRVHYPPDFDPQKKYPCIVYYYGGTSPVNRAFGGRYPKNLWASMGYVVYVLQPSGATGFGQEFSTAHVNDWGKTTAGEIIEGTGKFLQAHPFVDPERVGCIGASFGGFMTQLLVTKTDIFAAAVSHAGISDITSYWGEGYWGYAYNAVSAAGSFPWNRPDIYIDQSPLFAADKINTPLLLLHGASDTNVPPGESEQMYTALKLLGKEVEYIKFSGQNHFILDYQKRIAWSNAILGWFDKWLKDEPEWWNDMYPPLEGDQPEKPEKLEARRIELDDGRMILLGEVKREDIQRNLPDWDREYFTYTPDQEFLAPLEDLLQKVEITCVLGSWCSDSQREIPRFWKILEECGYPVSDLSMLAVASSRHTKSMGIPSTAFTWSKKTKEYYGIERVATIIVYREGKELGRIVETPEESLEKDLLEILKK